MGLSQIRGTLFRGPYNEDYSILGSILGSPYFGQLTYGEIPRECSGIWGEWNLLSCLGVRAELKVFRALG